MQVPIHIVLLSPPPGIAYGVQNGSGAQYKTEQVQISEGKDLRFKFDIEIKGEKSETPRFSGPYVQGKQGEKFVYLDIGAFAGQEGGWSMRLKVQLKGITWDLIGQVKEKKYLETRVAGSTKDGSPTCASVKPEPVYTCV
jgi:hypothetical protein